MKFHIELTKIKIYQIFLSFLRKRKPFVCQFELFVYQKKKNTLNVYNQRSKVTVTYFYKRFWSTKRKEVDKNTCNFEANTPKL